MPEIVTDIFALSAPSQLCSVEESEVIFKQLEDCIHKLPTAVGLAAPQIGIQKRCFVYYRDKVLIRVMNPVICMKSNSKSSSSEGCLSIPGQYYNVPRYKWIIVRDHFDPKNRKLVKEEANVFQHEIDHIDGILISNRGVFSYSNIDRI